MSLRPSAAWLPIAAVFGALVTLAVLSMSGSAVFPRWQHFSQWTTTASKAHRGMEAALKCPPPPACPAAKPCPVPAVGTGTGSSEQADSSSSTSRSSSAAGSSLDSWAKRLTVPWGPLLTQAEAQRGLLYYGSGERLQAVASKLLAGKPIKVFTLGASVTRGIGTTDRKYSYPNRFFEFIRTAFPHKRHVFVNRGIGGTSSSIYSACAEHMVHQDADLVVLEFTLNDLRDAPYVDPERRGYEGLIRKLLALPTRPAIIQLHHYGWWHAVGDGVTDGGLFYYPAGEAQFSVYAHYYDFPAMSVRASMYHLMRARVHGFNPDRARLGSTLSPTNVSIPGAEPGTEKQYWYRDRSHPGDEGHTMMAELLAHVLAKAVIEVLEPRPRLHMGDRDADMSGALEADGLPVPMIPGNTAVPTSMCAIQEDFKDVVKTSEGFEYKAEKPDGRNFVEQKWGWTGSQPGAWAEMEFDTESGFKNLGNDTSNDAQVSLSYLKSYQGMGTATVACTSGCNCTELLLDGTWSQAVSLQQVVQFPVSRHKRCRVRVTVSKQPGAVPQEGHKVTLMAVMVSHFPVRLTTYESQMSVLHQATI